jgi:MFS family permease
MARSWKVDFSLLVTGQAVSVFGSSLHLVVVILFLKELTGQAFALGIFQFVAYLPVIFLSPLGGVAADAFSAKRILVGADLLRGAAMLAMGLLLRRQMLTYGMLLAGTFLVSLGTAFFQPAVHALFPSIVNRSFLKRGNSIRGSTLLGSNFAGTSLGGLAFALLGPAAVFLINGGSFVVSALEEGFIRAPVKRGEPEKNGDLGKNSDLGKNGNTWKNGGPAEKDDEAEKNAPEERGAQAGDSAGSGAAAEPAAAPATGSTAGVPAAPATAPATGPTAGAEDRRRKSPKDRRRRALEGLLSRAPKDRRRAGEILRSLRKRLRETLAYLREDRGALSALLTYGMIHAVYPPVVLALPFFMEEEMGMGSVPYGYAMALLLAGGGAGALLYGFLGGGGRGNTGLLFGALLLLSGLLAAVGAAPRAAVLFPALLAAGACLGAVHQIMTTSLYRRVRAEARGRVFGLMESLASAALPISYGISGAVIELFRGQLPLFFVVIAGLSFGMTAAVFLRGRLGRFVAARG